MAEKVATQATSAVAEPEQVASPTTATAEEVVLEPQTAEAQPAETQEQLSTEVETEEEQETNLEEVPETSGDFAKYKDLFKANPELRKIIGREQAFSDIAPNGSFQELKAIVERVPSVSDAETLANAARSLEDLGRTYRTDPAGFVESLRENDGLAFQQLAKQLPEILASTDPSLYSEQARYYSNAVLDNLFAAAQRSGNQDAITSLQNVAAMLGAQLGMPRIQGPDNSEVAKLRRQLEERDQADKQSKASSFWESATNEHFETSTSEIEALIKKSIPDVNPATLKRMGSEVWETVNARLAQQPQTMAELERLKRDVNNGRMGHAEYKAIVDFSMKRTRQLIPLVWKEVSAEWSKEILRVNKEQIDKRKAIAGKTREITAPAVTQAPAGTRNPVPPKVPGGIRGILTKLATGTYQAPSR